MVYNLGPAVGISIKMQGLQLPSVVLGLKSPAILKACIWTKLDLYHNSLLKGLQLPICKGEHKLLLISISICKADVTPSFGKLVYYFDGADSPESMEICARWFCHAVTEDLQQQKSLEQPHDNWIATQSSLQNHPNELNKTVLWEKLNTNITVQLHASVRPSVASSMSNKCMCSSRDIYNANVRKIIFVRVGPLGCTPRILWESYNATTETDGNCTNEINEMVIEYNTILSANHLGLKLKLPYAQIIFCDVYLGIMDIITQPRTYGFENVDTACCGAGRYSAAVGCFSKAMAYGKSSNLIHVWWDLYNPTESVNSLLAEWMWSGTHLNLCHPINIQQLTSTSAILTVSTPYQQWP